MKLYKTKVLGYAFTLLLSASCSDRSKKGNTVDSRTDRLPYYDEATFTPVWLSEGSDSIEGFHRIPPFRLVNQLGKTITEETFKGKIYVANFFFTSCPGICPKMTSNLAMVQEAYKNDDSVLLLSHSVTPEYDSIPVLRNYAEIKGVDANKWHLVTGNRKEIYDLGRYAYFAEEDLGEPVGENDFLHTENFVLIDHDRHIRGIYNGLNKTSVRQLISDIKILQKEAIKNLQ